MDLRYSALAQENSRDHDRLKSWDYLSVSKLPDYYAFKHMPFLWSTGNDQEVNGQCKHEKSLSLLLYVSDDIIFLVVSYKDQKLYSYHYQMMIRNYSVLVKIF